MKIWETLERDPRHAVLANGGQARIIGGQDEQRLAELRRELETFVCDGQYANAIERILTNYLEDLASTRQKAAWISGFFGSGKSHLLKMLGHLWVNTEFPDGKDARSLVREMPEDIRALLKELDTQAKRLGQPLVAAAGALPAGRSDNVRLTILAVILSACGLPENVVQARFWLWLREQGYLESVQAAVAEAGKEWRQELNSLYMSTPVARALLKCDPTLGADEREVKQALRQQFPQPSGDLTTEEFITLVNQVLAKDGQLPLTVLVLDEAQQYLGDSSERVAIFVEAVEAIQTQLASRVMLVASGQSALTGTDLLKKMLDRFRIRVNLSDSDVEVVTRKVLLQKKPSGVAPIRKILDENAGEISKHLHGSSIAVRHDDGRFMVDDYPLLPTRRRFWEECFRALDAAGTHSQLRSQLRIIDDALRKVAGGDIGVVIPADALFEALAPDLVNTGILLSDTYTKIQALAADPSDEAQLKKRLLGLIFMINKLPRDAAHVDQGIRATPAMLADLLVEDVRTDSGPLRKRVEAALQELADASLVMKIGDEYRIQTPEGAEWDRAYRERVAMLTTNITEVEIRRQQLLYGEMQKLIQEIRPRHGLGKIERKLVIHTGQDSPQPNDKDVVVWLQDAWSTSQHEVEGEARRRGPNDPVVHVFLPRDAGDTLRQTLVETMAAQDVLDQKGTPDSPAGKEARNSMISRYDAANLTLTNLVNRILQSARVYQGGGTEVFGESLRERIVDAVEASLARLFPRFHDGDHKGWGAAVSKARHGSDQALQAVDWNKPAEDHPVAREVLAAVSNGASGADVRKKLMVSPYGWEKDAIDAVLITLVRTGSLRTTVNGQPVPASSLDQNRIASAEFRPEKVRLSVQNRLNLKGLYSKLNIQAADTDLEERAHTFLDRMLELAHAAGGEAPLPSRPNPTIVHELKRLAGSELLGAILQKRDELEKAITEWSVLRDRAVQRFTAWQQFEQLHAHAAGLPVASEVGPEIEAIKTSRLLLEDTDHVAPLQAKVVAALRDAIDQSHEALSEAISRGLEELESDANWQSLGAEVQAELRTRFGLQPPTVPRLETAADLLAELQRQSLSSRSDAVAAVRDRVAQALVEAARRLKPKAKLFPLRRTTLETEEDVRAWLAEQEQQLLTAIKDGPVTLS